MKLEHTKSAESLIRGCSVAQQVHLLSQLTLTSPLSPPWVLAFCGVKTQTLGWGRGMPSYLSPQGWALFKTRDFHHLKAVQLACKRYGGREGETVSSWQGRSLVKARRAVVPALRARPQLADRGTACRFTSQGFLPPRTKCSWALTG